MLFAQDVMTPDLDKLQNDLKESVDLYESLTLALFLLAGYALLFLAWGLYRRLRPAAPGEARVPVTFVAWLFAGMVGLPLTWLQVVRAWNQLTPVEQADVLAFAHIAVVAGVVGAQLLVLAGWPLRWRWVTNFWFRLGHLMLIHLIVSQNAVGLYCPLTSWEFKLRYPDAYAMENASELARWSRRMLVLLSESNLLVIYISFAAAVLLSWVFVPPRWPWAARDEGDRGA